MVRALHVEPDLTLARLLRQRLATDGVVLDHAPSLAEARSLLAAREYAAVVLELQLPDGDALDVVGLLRSTRQAVPMLVVSARGSEETIIRTLEAGADDYVVKPASLEMLRARFRALVRRGGARDGEVLRVGVLAVDRGRREAWVGERALRLSAIEFNLLAHLAAHPGHVQSRDALLAAVWGRARAYGPRASNIVAVTVGRVRRRLETAPGAPAIEAVRGIGYVLRAPGRAAEWAARAGLASGWLGGRKLED